MRLIDADELLKRLKDNVLTFNRYCDIRQAINACIAEVLAMPQINIEEEKEGKNES